MNNEYALKCLIQLSVESAREEINKIDLVELETLLPQDKFNYLFDRICTIDATQKVIQMAIQKIIHRLMWIQSLTRQRVCFVYFTF